MIEEAQGEQNKMHEVLEKGDDEVHTSGDFEVFDVDGVGHSSGFCHWSLPEIPYLSFKGLKINATRLIR